MFKTMRVRVIKCELYAEGSSEVSLNLLVKNVFRVCMEFDFFSIQIIESQPCLKLRPQLQVKSLNCGKKETRCLLVSFLPQLKDFTWSWRGSLKSKKVKHLAYVSHQGNKNREKGHSMFTRGKK